MKYIVLSSFVVLTMSSNTAAIAQEIPAPATTDTAQVRTGQTPKKHRRIWGAGGPPQTNTNSQMVTDNDGKLKPFQVSDPLAPPPETSVTTTTSPQ